MSERDEQQRSGEEFVFTGTQKDIGCHGILRRKATRAAAAPLTHRADLSSQASFVIRVE